jgi:membrane protease YdiL (CAAX protease family)
MERSRSSVADRRGQAATLLQSLAIPVLAFAVGQALVLAAALVLGALGLFEGVTAVSQLPMWANVLLTCLNFVGFGIGAGVFLWYYDLWGMLRARLPTLGDAGWTVAGLLALLAAQVVIGVAMQALGVQSAQNQVIVQGRENPVYFLYMVPVTLLFVGPFEELVFRGGVQGLLRRAFSAPVAVGAASAIFGVGHWFALTGGGSRFAYIAVAAALGVVLGALYERTDNLVVPAVTHGLFNTVVFLIQYGVAVGAVPSG